MGPVVNPGFGCALRCPRVTNALLDGLDIELPPGFDVHAEIVPDDMVFPWLVYDPSLNVPEPLFWAFLRGMAQWDWDVPAAPQLSDEQMVQLVSEVYAHVGEQQLEPTVENFETLGHMVLALLDIKKSGFEAETLEEAQQVVDGEEFWEQKQRASEAEQKALRKEIALHQKEEADYWRLKIAITVQEAILRYYEQELPAKKEQQAHKAMLTEEAALEVHARYGDNPPAEVLDRLLKGYRLDGSRFTWAPAKQFDDDEHVFAVVMRRLSRGEPSQDVVEAVNENLLGPNRRKYWPNGLEGAQEVERGKRTEKLGRQLCGKPTKTGQGQPCRNPVRGNWACRTHRGPNVPTARYWAVLPESVRVTGRRERDSEHGATGQESSGKLTQLQLRQRWLKRLQNTHAEKEQQRSEDAHQNEKQRGRRRLGVAQRQMAYLATEGRSSSTRQRMKRVFTPAWLTVFMAGVEILQDYL